MKESIAKKASARSAFAKMAAILLVCGTVVAAGSADALTLKGKGEVHAYGNGLAVFHMVGVFTVRGGGLLVVEPDAQVQTFGIGRETALADGRILYEGFGRAVVASFVATRIEVAGARLRLHGRGAGVAFLKGAGVVFTDDLDRPWDPDVELEFESDD